MLVEPGRQSAAGVRRPPVLPERIQVKPHHRVDSAAYPIAAGSYASDKPRSQIGADRYRHPDATVQRRRAGNDRVCSCLHGLGFTG